MRLETPRCKELGDVWAPANGSDWSTARGTYGRLVEPMARAVRAAGGPVHEQAATSLQVLRLPGHRDNVTAKQIGNYFHKGAREPSLKKKGGGVLRWCGRALVDVAELVWRHGPELRAAMQGKLDAQPSAAEELEQTRRERDQQQLLAEEVRRQKEEAHAEAERAKDKATTMPTVRQVQLMRTELTVASEVIAALRIALAKRIISFGFDESTKYGLGLLSTNVQLEPHYAPGTSEDVVPRGACLIAGGKATEVSAAVEKKIFQHGRVLLRRWKQRHEKLHGEGSWAADGGPDPEALGLHRLTEHTTLVSDTCNAARAAKRLLAEMCEASAQTQIGDEAWQAMGEAERRSKVATYLGDCSGHLRNIVINAMMIKATEYLNAELADDLSTFSSFDRVSLEGIDWIRAAYKEFHGGGEYAKGKGREFIAWLHEHHADAFFMPLENTHGTRMDISFDGMVPIFANRKLMAEFLHQLVNAPGANDNRTVSRSASGACSSATR